MTKSKLRKMLLKEFEQNNDNIVISFISNRIDVELFFQIFNHGFEYEISLFNDEFSEFVDDIFIEKTDNFEYDIDRIAEEIIKIENIVYKAYIGEDVTEENVEDPIDSFFN